MDKRYARTITGIVIVVLSVVAAASNLQEIYAAQKDFVLGSMLSLAGFVFGKAVDRSKQDHDRWPHNTGAIEHLSKLES